MPAPRAGARVAGAARAAPVVAVLLLTLFPPFAPVATATTPALVAGAAAPAVDHHGTRTTSGSDSSDEESARWRWPVPPPVRVLAPFRAPPTPYSPGHRGIDLAAEPGATILAPADGVVSFAGPVAGRGVVSIDHGGGVVSAIEPVDALVAVGTSVRAGDTIGTVSSGGHCDTGCVHFGVRVHGEYVSPFLFLGGMPRAVLLPAN
jgi:murein DD-endopeptidase MepM/ murein hydrolase activator NlpD